MKILVLAMGRTGHHAIIRWIVNGLDDTVIYNSNCINGWDKRRLEPNKIEVKHPNLEFKYTSASDDKLNSELTEFHIIKSIEDISLRVWVEKGMYTWESFDQRYTVVRSPRNWLASSIAAGGYANDCLDKSPKSERCPVSRIEAFKTYLDNLYTVTKECDFSIINYDTWLRSKTYRDVMARRNGFKDTGLPMQCKFSSFKKPYNHGEDRSKLLSKKQKKRFDELYDNELQDFQKRFF